MNDLGLVLTLAISISGMAQVTSVPCWQPQDFEFQSSTGHDNPFMVRFSATIAGPDGGEFETLGFYDGDGIWKIRVAPNKEGKWLLITHSDDPNLNNKKASFVCVANSNPEVHGGLKVDPENPYHFVYEDGTRYFMNGYECDWLWALDMMNPEIKTLEAFLDKMAKYSFNHIILNAYAHDCGWRKGNTGDDDYGPPHIYAWLGTNEEPDHSRFNLAYWKHYDRMMDSLYRHGIIAHIMIKVYNKMVKWPAIGSGEDDLYFKWLMARYAPYPNVVWCFSKEAHNEKNLDYKLGRFKLIRETDPYHRLITDHDDDGAYDSGAYDSLLDFRADQHHSKWHQKILEQRKQKAWPVSNVEFGYEHGPKGIEDKTYGVVQSPEEVCRRAWEICMAGGYIAYYYTYTAWDIIRPEDEPVGYDYFKKLYDFFTSTGYWKMNPADELVSEGYCLANPGKEYIVFLNQAKAFTLKLEGNGKSLKGEWYHPFTGEKVDAGVLNNGTVELKPPVKWGEAQVALHIII
jgi:hypothetical protein